MRVTYVTIHIHENSRHTEKDAAECGSGPSTESRMQKALMQPLRMKTGSKEQQICVSMAEEKQRGKCRPILLLCCLFAGKATTPESISLLLCLHLFDSTR